MDGWLLHARLCAHWQFSWIKFCADTINVLWMRLSAEVHCVSNHAHKSHTHLKGTVIHVRVWWIMETPKQPSSLGRVDVGHYTEDRPYWQQHTNRLLKMSALVPITKKKKKNPPIIVCIQVTGQNRYSAVLWKMSIMKRTVKLFVVDWPRSLTSSCLPSHACDPKKKLLLCAFR